MGLFTGYENNEIINKYISILETKDNKYDELKDILSKNGIIAIKGSVAVASSILTLDAEKKFFDSKSFKDNGNYIVDYQSYEKIKKYITKNLKKWHEDKGLPYYGK